MAARAGCYFRRRRLEGFVRPRRINSSREVVKPAPTEARLRKARIGLTRDVSHPRLEAKTLKLREKSGPSTQHAKQNTHSPPHCRLNPSRCAQPPTREDTPARSSSRPPNEKPPKTDEAVLQADPATTAPTPLIRRPPNPSPTPADLALHNISLTKPAHQTHQTK